MTGRLFAAVFAGAVLLSAGPAGAASPAVEACQECHGETGIGKSLPDGSSVHGKAACTSCHADAKAPHGKLAKVDCGRCHAGEAGSYAGSSHGKLHAKGVADVPACHDCHGRHDIRKAGDPASKTFRLNIAGTCLRCHRDRPAGGGERAADAVRMIGYENSVHGMAAKAGQVGSAVCSDCHGNHSILPGDDPRAATNRLNVPAMCGSCHSGISYQYEKSIHGKALRAGVAESPVCTDCHGEHDISRVDQEGSPVAARNIPKTCTGCHDKEAITSRYALPKKRFSSYLDSFHGIAVEYGMTTAANCASCHGVHDILPSSDPASSVNRENLPKTCGKCHPNAGANFARGPVHVEVTPSKSPGVFAVRAFYIIFISSLVILFLLHIGFETYGRWRGRRGGGGSGGEGKP